MRLKKTNNENSLWLFLKRAWDPHKKQIIFKNKIEIDVPKKKFLGGAHDFCFTNMKIVLQKCIPKKLIWILIKFTICG